MTRDQGRGKVGSARAAAGRLEGRGGGRLGVVARGKGLGRRGERERGDAAPPPSSKRRRSCSRTNCSILFTVEEEQKSGYLLEYLFGIVRRHTKGASLCGGIPPFPREKQ